MSAVRSSGLCASPSGTLLPLSPPTLSLASAANTAFEALFDNPPDLVCPVTHELFKEPVINAAGQVYERSAIEAYMRRSLMDPVTRMQLHPTSVLTPVWIVKSRYDLSKLCFVSILSCFCSAISVQAGAWSTEKAQQEAVSSKLTAVLDKVLSDMCAELWSCVGMQTLLFRQVHTQQILPKHFLQQSIL